MMTFNEETIFDDDGNSEKKFYINKSSQSKKVFDSMYEEYLTKFNCKINENSGEDFDPYLLALIEDIQNSSPQEAIQILSVELVKQYTSGLLMGKREIMENIGVVLLKQSALCDEQLKNLYEE